MNKYSWHKSQIILSHECVPNEKQSMNISIFHRSSQRVPRYNEHFSSCTIALTVRVLCNLIRRNPASHLNDATGPRDARRWGEATAEAFTFSSRILSGLGAHCITTRTIIFMLNKRRNCHDKRLPWSASLVRERPSKGKKKKPVHTLNYFPSINFTISRSPRERMTWIELDIFAPKIHAAAPKCLVSWLWEKQRKRERERGREREQRSNYRAGIMNKCKSA